jgi:hypothetical protein
MQLTNLFSSGYDFILAANTTNPQWETVSAYKILPVELQRIWEDPHQLIGIRPERSTNYLLIDVDQRSKYHPYNATHEWCAFLFRLEQIGLIDPIFVRSSHSDGIHIYYWFPDRIESFKLAALVRIWLENDGFDVSKGQIETFPNTKTYDSQYNAHRLPLQPDSGALLLDQHGDPLEIAANRDHHSQLAYFAEQSIQAQQSMATLKTKLVWGYEEFVKSRYRRTSSGVDVGQWRQNWAETIELGWTGRGQTNELLHVMVGYSIVFEGIEDKRELFDRVKSLILSTPGYRQYCNHQHQIDHRIWDWVNLTIDRNYYTPYQSRPGRTGEFPGLTIDRADAKRPKSTERHDNIVDRLTTTIQTIIERLGQLPDKIRDRIQAIVGTSKELFGSGFGINTLYKSCYFGLWQSAETAENRQEPETVTAVCRSHICDRDVEPENNAETLTAVCRSHISAPMKVIHLDAECIINPDLDLPQVNTEVLELELDSPSISTTAFFQHDLDLDLPETDRSLFPERSSELEQELRLFARPPQPEQNLPLHISSHYELQPPAKFFESISGADDSPNCVGVECPPDPPKPDPNALPPVKTPVKRIEHVYRGKTYPEIFAVITGNFGLSCAAVESDGGHYHFDLCDWLVSWFPLNSGSGIP